MAQQTHADALQHAARRVEARLQELLQVGPPRLQAALRHATLGGGKRLRPVLCLWTAELFETTASGLALEVGCALELMHTYSLVHDDLPCMDDDELRRGQPTVHVAFDEATAVLVGDALQCLAFETLLRAPWQDAARARQAALDLAEAAGARHLVGGQLLDLEAEGKEAEASMVEAIHCAKTAALLRCAMVLGARAGGARDADIERIGIVGASLGLAFQIIDDLLDESTTATLGKTAGKDRRAGKATWPAVHGVQRSRQDAARLIEQAVEALQGWPRHQRLLWLARHLGRRAA